MFETTGPFALFDYFRVPYKHVDDEPAAPGLASLSVRGEAATLFWPLADAQTSDRRRPSGYFLGATPLFGRVAPDKDVRSWLRRIGGDGRRHQRVRKLAGSHRSGCGRLARRPTRPAKPISLFQRVIIC